MANQPHPDRKAVTWRLHRDLVTAVQAAAQHRDETVLAFATRALERELRRPALHEGQAPPKETPMTTTTHEWRHEVRWACLDTLDNARLAALAEAAEAARDWFLARDPHGLSVVAYRDDTGDGPTGGLADYAHAVAAWLDEHGVTGHPVSVQAMAAEVFDTAADQPDTPPLSRTGS